MIFRETQISIHIYGAAMSFLKNKTKQVRINKSVKNTSTMKFRDQNR